MRTARDTPQLANDNVHKDVDCPVHFRPVGMLGSMFAELGREGMMYTLAEHLRVVHTLVHRRQTQPQKTQRSRMLQTHSLEHVLLVRQRNRESTVLTVRHTSTFRADSTYEATSL
jgi:hypothetical protein